MGKETAWIYENSVEFTVIVGFFFDWLAEYSNETRCEVKLAYKMTAKIDKFLVASFFLIGKYVRNSVK